MKPLKEAFINKNNIKNVSHGPYSKWPNPYNLSEEDMVKGLTGVPIEIATLALKRAKEDKGERYTVKLLKIWGFQCSFRWDRTKEGVEFWNKIDIGDYDEFYKMYDPEKLKKN